MKLNPTEAPLYGECVLTVQLEDDDTCPGPEEELGEFFLFFSGSSQRHLTSTVRVSRVTLQAVCPGHNVCEQVLVVLCVARPNGAVINCSQENFTFVQDWALDTAHLMLQNATLWKESKECKKLDERLVLALKHLSQLYSLGPRSPPHTHSPREDLQQTQADCHENITHCSTEENSSETETETEGSTPQHNCLTGQQQLSGLLHLAGDSGVNRTSPFIPPQPAHTGPERSSSDWGPRTDCEDWDHLQRLLPFTRCEALNEESCVDPDGVFQHHLKLGTFTLTIPNLIQQNKPDFCLQDGVAQLRRLIRQYKGIKGIVHCGTDAAVNPTAPAHEEILDSTCANSPHEENHSEHTSDVSPGSTQTARSGRNRRNKKRTTKTATRTVTQSPGSPLVAAGGTAPDAVTDTKPLLSPEQGREITLTEKDCKEDLSQMPTSPDSDEPSGSSRKSAAAACVEKQEGAKWEVEQILLDQVTQNLASEPGPNEELKTKVCLGIPHEAEETDGKETMGQDQSQPSAEDSEPPAHPEAEETVPTTALDGAAADSNSAMKEAPKSLTIWYDGEQLDTSEDPDSTQLSAELCQTRPRQLSPPTLTQPHAIGHKPARSHAHASQRQEAPGSQRDEEAGPEWEKANTGEEVKRSSENDEDTHGGDRGNGKSRKKKRKKRGKRGGIERNQLSSTSSVESQSQADSQTQVTEHIIQDNTGKIDIPTVSNTMHLPNQMEAQDEGRDGTSLVALEASMTELSGTTGLDILRELSEDKATIFNESDELVWEPASAQSEEMDVRVTEGSQVDKREFLLDDCNGEVLRENSPGPEQLDKTLLVHFDNKPQLVKSPEIIESAGASDSPVDGTADVPSLQTREGSAEITTGHCLASDMLGYPSLTEEENKNELWKEEKAKIGSLQRREVMELCSNNVAGVPCLGSELELAATAVAVVTVAVASAMAEFELCERFAEDCTKAHGINPITDETLSPCNVANSVNTSSFTQEEAYVDSRKVDFSIDFAQEMDSNGNQTHSTNQALLMRETENDLAAEKLSLHQTIQATSSDRQPDSSNQEVLVSSRKEQMKCDLTAEESHVLITDNEDMTASETKQNTSVVLPKEFSDMSSDACPALDTGQGGQFVSEVDIAEELSKREITVGLNVEADEGCSSKEEQMVPLSCDSPFSSSFKIMREFGHCPEESMFVESEVTEQEFTRELLDADIAVVVKIKDDASEIVDQEEDDVVDGWRERERVNDDDQKQTDAGTGSVEQEETKRSVADCLRAAQIQRETDVFCPVQHCPDSSSQTAIPEENTKGSLVCLQEEDDLPQTNTEAQDSVFKEPCDPSTADSDQKVRVSWSSADDASSLLGTFSEEPSISTSDANTSRLSWKSEAEDTALGEMEGVEEEEKKDQLPINIVSSAILRASHRSLSPSRRHSWEPGRNDIPPNVGQSSRLKSPSEESRPAKTPSHRRSMSWCPSNLAAPDPEPLDNRSCSLEGLVEAEHGALSCPGLSEPGERGQEQSCFTEEDQQTHHQVLSMTSSCPGMFHHQTLTKSVSMVTISHRDIDGSSSFVCNSVECSISEEEPGPLRSSTEVKGGPRISRTFSYLRNKMTKKGKEKEKDRKGEKDREPKDRDKKSPHGHVLVLVCPPASSCCHHCHKPLQTKECLFCSNCGVHVHKSCRDSVAVCAKSKNKLQVMAPDAAPPATNTRTKSTSSTGSTVSSVSSSSRWSTATTPEDQFPSVQPKRTPSIFTTHGNLSKSISTSNIAGLDDVTLKSLKVRSQSTDSLNQNSAVSASTESLTDEGTEMMDNQLMGEFEWDIKDLEADSWSSTVDKKLLKTLKKDEIKRQDVIYELYQTEFHHVRTLRIMSEVYYKGIQKELQLDLHTLDKIFPMMDDLVETHTEFLHQLLEQKRGSLVEGQQSNFIICSIGDTLVKQFSGSSAERMKKVYGKFCSRHNEAVNLYKDLLAKDKRFQNFIKKVMSSAIVRRLSIPECILLVTQRITKYPVLIQRILQHTKETDSDHVCVSEALQLVKEIITAVDSKVNEQEKKRRLKEVYSRTDSKSIMRMKSGQMFAKEDLVRGRRLLHDGALQLKNTAGRLKEVHSLLLSDVLVFLQEKDQKYVFAALDQRSTVISLQNLIVREVANEERGLFLITAGTEKPEMVEVLASSKEERNTWRAIIQDAMQCMEKDEDEGIPSETEEDRRQQESRVKEIRELLRSKDEQIVSLLEEKVLIFRELSDCSAALYDAYPAVRERMLFRATPDDITKGEPIIREALKEVESLHSFINTGLGGAACSVSLGPAGGGVGPVSLPRRAETFGGFDSHQMNISKNGEKEEADESVDLRRTESDSVLKKGATASLQLLLKRSNEQVHSSVTHLHDLLLSLQAVVVQQDSFIEDQRQALNERLSGSSRHSSSSSLSSTSSSRPSSLIEQEKHRSLERQRQEAASLQKQQAAHLEEKRRREREWEVRDRVLCEREEKLKEEEEHVEKRRQELLDERELLQRNREQYHRDLERLREAQLRLERDKEALRRDSERLEAQHREQTEQLQRFSRTSSITSEDSVRFPSTSSLDLDCREAEQSKEVELSTSAPTKEPFLRIGSKRMGKNFNPFASSSKSQGAEKEPSRLLQLTKPKKDKKDKKKKKGDTLPAGTTAVLSDFQKDDNFSC